jgi:hypothetical protein
MTDVNVAGNPAIDPTLPKVELKLGNKTYFLCFTFKALALAQTILRNNGIDCNLLQSLDLTALQADRLVPLLYAGLITHMPEITLEEVFELVLFRNMHLVFEAVVLAYGASMAEPDPDAAPVDPTLPA